MKSPLIKCCLVLSMVAGNFLLPSLVAAQSTEPSASVPIPSLEGKRSPDVTATKHVDDALAVVKQMEFDATMRKLMQDASGIFIVPTYGRAALGIGAHGGAGVLLIKKASGNWTDPIFYNIGGINIGAQVGAQAGAVAFILNNERYRIVQA